jgi:hypothetical protein
MGGALLRLPLMYWGGRCEPTIRESNFSKNVLTGGLQKFKKGYYISGKQEARNLRFF